MQFVSLALLAALTSVLNVSADTLNLRSLGFVLYGRHGDGEKTTVATGRCPLGTLPDTVFLHKTFQRNDHFFTWVRPVHRRVNKVVCESHLVWEGATDEFLMDLHFFGRKDSRRFVHLELLHRLGGSVHVFLEFDEGANPGAGRRVGMARFVAGARELVRDLHSLEGLPAHHLMEELRLHAEASTARTTA